ncbi:MAG TPA: hypothetical protein PK688_03795, partial [Tenuifilaceae bacterium]|nr:hypothetical protein [Tenuifilaceae bacterium]
FFQQQRERSTPVKPKAELGAVKFQQEGLAGVQRQDLTHGFMRGYTLKGIAVSTSGGCRVV